MNHDLRHSLRALADTGADATMPREILTENVRLRAGRAHRRRPVIVAGLTTAGVLTAGAAAALGITYFSQDEGPALPDVLFPGAGPTAPGPEQPPTTDPLALQCGDMAGDPGDTGGDLWLAAPDAYDDPDLRGEIALDAAGTGALLPVAVTSTSPGDVSLTITENVGIYLVSGGFVVAVPDVATSIPSELTLGPDDSVDLPTDGLTWCDPDQQGTPGEYEALGRVRVTLDEQPDTPVTVTGGPWFVVVPGDPGDGSDPTTDDPSGTDAAPVQLATADPSATAPQCGATIETDMDPVVVSSDVDLPALTVGPDGATFPVLVENLSGVVQESTTTEMLLVVVKDGVVVGSSPSSPSTTPYTLGEYQTADLTGRLVLAACRADGGPSVPLPEGRYEVWAANAWGADTSANRVANLWIDGAGAPTASPAVADGWPRAIEPLYAIMAPQYAQSVVWLSATEDAGTLRAIDELGYGDHPLPAYCQASSDTEIPLLPMNATGVAVVFASADDAAAFVERYEGPVLGVVDREVYCIFD